MQICVIEHFDSSSKGPSLNGAHGIIVCESIALWEGIQMFSVSILVNAYKNRFILASTFFLNIFLL